MFNLIVIGNSWPQLCLGILRQFYHKLGFNQQFRVLGAEEQKEVVRTAVIKWEESQGGQSHTKQTAQRAYKDMDINAAEVLETDEMINETLGSGSKYAKRAKGMLWCCKVHTRPNTNPHSL